MAFLEKEYIRLSNRKTERAISIQMRHINERMVNIKRSKTIEMLEGSRLKRNAIKGSVTPNFKNTAYQKSLHVSFITLKLME